MSLLLLYYLQLCSFFVAVAISWQEQNIIAAGSNSAATLFHTMNELSTGDVVVGGQSNGAMEGEAAFGSNDFIFQQYNSSLGLKWTRQIGSAGSDVVKNMCVDDNDNIYAVGVCSGVFDGHTAYGLSDICFVKYGSDGTKKVSGQMGGSGEDYSSAIVVDKAGKYFYIAGSTLSPVINGTAKTGTSDTIWMKYDAITGQMIKKSLYGEINKSFYFNDIALDSANNSILTGYTSSSSYRGIANKGTCNLLYTKLSAEGDFEAVDLQGGSGCEQGMAVTIDSQDNAYLLGTSTSLTVNNQLNHGGADVIVLKYNTHNLLQYTLVVGGNGDELVHGVTVSSNDTNNGTNDANSSSSSVLYVTGSTTSSRFYGYYHNTAQSCAFLLTFDTHTGMRLSAMMYCGDHTLATTTTLSSSPSSVITTTTSFALTAYAVAVASKKTKQEVDAPITIYLTGSVQGNVTVTTTTTNNHITDGLYHPSIHITNTLQTAFLLLATSDNTNQSITNNNNSYDNANNNNAMIALSTTQITYITILVCLSIALCGSTIYLCNTRLRTKHEDHLFQSIFPEPIMKQADKKPAAMTLMYVGGHTNHMIGPLHGNDDNDVNYNMMTRTPPGTPPQHHDKGHRRGDNTGVVEYNNMV